MTFRTFPDSLFLSSISSVSNLRNRISACAKNKGNAEVERGVDHFVFYYPHYQNMKDVLPQAAIRYGDYKLRKEYETETLMLFDLSKDLGEQNDLSQSNPELTASMHKRLNTYLADISAKVPTKNPDYDPKEDKGLNNQFFFGGSRPPQNPAN